jgi:hypothetical protein
MRVALLSFIFLSLSIVYGQGAINRYTISGSITDSLGHPVANAVVILRSENGDNQFSQICDNGGKFRFTGIAAEQYLIKVLHASYDEYNSSLNVNSDMSLEPIVLHDNIREIEAVMVTANTIRYGADNYVVSMQNNPLTNGRNALDILGYLPHVKDVNGEITILGQVVGTIRINGIIITDKEELKSIQAENLGDIEVVLTPRHSTDSRGGEINLRLKKTADGGFYGSLVGQSSAYFSLGHDNSTVSSSFSYGIKKLSLYNYFLSGAGKEYYDDSSYTRYKENGTTKIATASTRMPRSTISERLSMNYEINNKHTFGANLRYGYTSSRPAYFSNSDLTNTPIGISSFSGAKNEAIIINNQYQASFIYSWLLNDAGSSFKLTGDYLHYATATDRNYEYLYNIGEQDAYSDYSRNNIDNKVDMLYVNAAFSLIAAKKHRLRFGANFNSNRTRQLLNYENFQNGIWINNEDRSDNYKLTGDDYSAFFDFSSKIGNKMTYDLSVRYRGFVMGYNSLKASHGNRKRFNNAEITANLMYHINKGRGDMLYFAYERWYDRIPYSAISPVVTYIDEYSYTKGNLALEPTVMDNLFLTLTLRNNTEFNIRLQRTNNYGIRYETFVDDTNPLVTYTMPTNGSPSYNARFTIDHTFGITKWWKFNVYGLVEWRRYTPQYPLIHKNNSWIALATVENRFELSKNFGGKVSFFGRTNSRLDERTFGPEGSVTFSMYNYFFNRKLLLSVDGTIFNHKKRTITETDDLWIKHSPMTKLSRIALRLSYIFTGGKKVKVKTINGVQRYDEIKDELFTQ